MKPKKKKKKVRSAQILLAEAYLQKPNNFNPKFSYNSAKDFFIPSRRSSAVPLFSFRTLLDETPSFPTFTRRVNEQSRNKIKNRNSRVVNVIPPVLKLLSPHSANENGAYL